MFWGDGFPHVAAERSFFPSLGTENPEPTILLGGLG